MKLKRIFIWFYQQICNYNLFIPDIVDNDDNDDNENNVEIEDPTVLLKRQKQATWLYILFLLICLYILFYITMIKPESKTITVSSITPDIFNELYEKHASTLSCPCSIITVPYKTFVFNNITLHSVCSSLFVSKQWIESLYLTDSSLYAVSDFRTTANSQFKILSNLCSLSQKIIDENENDFDYNEVVSVDLRSEEHIQAEVNASVKFLQNTLSSQMISFLNYFRTTIQANYLISALNTNAVVQRPTSANNVVATALRTVYSLTSTAVCSVQNPTSPAAFFGFSYELTYAYMPVWGESLRKYSLVSGFYGSCTPLEALLVSTLNCLYVVDCLNQLYNYFPMLNQTNWNLTNYVLLSAQQNISLYDHLSDLFIDEWLTIINYSLYFDECAPSFCTYRTTIETNFASAIALLISLYGGLTIILRLIASLIINIVSKFKRQSNNIHIQLGSLKKNSQKYIQWLKRLNLFKREDDRTESGIIQQRIITRVYLFLLLISFVILLLFTSLKMQTITVTVSNPSLDTFHNLQYLYSNTLVCPCSNIRIPYESFIRLLPSFHQICSSDFVSQPWFTILQAVAVQKVSIDWLNQALSQFQLLSNLCELANETIDDAIRRFMAQSFITSYLLVEFDIDTQMNATLNQFFQSTVLYFDFVVDIIRLLTQVDQPYMGVPGNSRVAFETNIYGNTVTNITNGQQSVHFKFFFSGTRNIYTTLVECICATNPYCQSAVGIYDIDYISTSRYNFNLSYIIPGLVGGCSTMDSLLHSTLECFYENSECFTIVINRIKETYIETVEYSSWFDIHPLVYDPIMTPFLPNTSIIRIIKELMIEKWNPSISYEHYYQSCAPTYCIYSETIRTRTIISVITTLVSMLGGLTVSLRLLTVLLMKSIYSLIKWMKKSQQERQEQVRQKLLYRLKTTMKRLIFYFGKKLIDLNIFHLNDFRSNTDRMEAKQIGRWATRLFICLLITIIAILGLYTLIQPQVLTKTFHKPSLIFYNELKKKYDNRLECSCSLIATKYDKFVNIKPIFHEICLSSIVTDEWRNNLTVRLISNLSLYDEKDYRRFLSAHLQLLTGLCQLSNQSVNDAINQFLSSLFISDQLLSEDDFHKRLNLSIKRIISNAPTTLTRLLDLIEDMNNGNAIMSTYGTNFEHIIPVYESTRLFAQTQSIIYDDNCTCGLFSNCTSQAYFIENNISMMFSIKGLKIGCTPSESFRLSTLECFYNQSCLNLIQEYTYSTYTSVPILTVSNRFPVNTTIIELINELFVDEWLTTMNYSSYFEHCSPRLCTYTYIQQINFLYMITLIIGLQGGLTIVLKWICPKLVQFIFKIKNHSKKKRIIVQPTYTVDITPFPSDTSTNSDNITSGLELITPNMTIQTPFNASICHPYKMILNLILLLILSTAVILFSIYLREQEKNPNNVTVSSTITMYTNVYSNITTTMMTSTTTSSSSTAVICRPKFQQITAFRNKSLIYAYSPVVADFNNDGRLDIAFLQGIYGSMTVLLQHVNGTFQSPIISQVNCVTSTNVLAVNDFNSDNQLDIVGSCGGFDYIYVLFGNGNGTFGTKLILPTGNGSNPKGVAIADFNGDNNPDIAVTHVWGKKVGIFFSNSNGTFSPQMTISTGRNSFPRSIAITDVDNDGHRDIAVVNNINRNIGIFLGHDNGTFQTQETFFTGGGSYPYNIAVGDFNNDNISDVLCSYQSKTSMSILFGYGNGSLSEIKRIPLQSSFVVPEIVVADINIDHHLDIVIGVSSPYAVYALIADGNGNFQQQTLYLSNSSVSLLGIAIGDFNNDDYLDVITTTYQGYTIDVFFNTGDCFIATNP